MLIDPTFAYILPFLPRFTRLKPFVEPVFKPRQIATKPFPIDSVRRDRSCDTTFVYILPLLPEIPDLKPYRTGLQKPLGKPALNCSHSMQLFDTR